MQALDENLRSKIIDLQASMEELPQYTPSVRHYYANGFYAREMFVVAGAVIVGKIHKSEHLCIMSSGDVTLASEEKSARLTGHNIYVSKPGAKRAFYVHADSIWTTVHKTDETDLEKLEQELIAESFEALPVDDFQLLLTETGYTEEWVNSLRPKTPLDEIQVIGLELRPSNIHGLGFFATESLSRGSGVCLMLQDKKPTAEGWYFNHAKVPNCELRCEILYTLRDIQVGEELTVNYRQTKAEVERICLS